MKTDAEIARQVNLHPIDTIADKAGLTPDEYTQWGNFKAKISLSALESRKQQSNGKLILVTTITPTP